MDETSSQMTWCRSRGWNGEEKLRLKKKIIKQAENQRTTWSQFPLHRSSFPLRSLCVQLYFVCFILPFQARDKCDSCQCCCVTACHSVTVRMLCVYVYVITELYVWIFWSFRNNHPDVNCLLSLCLGVNQLLTVSSPCRAVTACYIPTATMLMRRHWWLHDKAAAAWVSEVLL